MLIDNKVTIPLIGITNDFGSHMLSLPSFWLLWSCDGQQGLCNSCIIFNITNLKLQYLKKSSKSKRPFGTKTISMAELLWLYTLNLAIAQ